MNKAFWKKKVKASSAGTIWLYEAVCYFFIWRVGN